MTRFQVSTEHHGEHMVYVLRDMHTNATARIVPALGANCLQLSLAPADDDPTVPVIDDLKYIDKAGASPSRYGIPVLFPWPSGIADGAFQYGGKVWNLNAPGEKKTRHHGFANTSSWQALRSDCDNTGAWLTCAFDSANGGELAKKFPTRCRLEITWKLRPNKFEMELEAQNTGDAPMPLGVGLHPYFTIPFGPKGSRAECRLQAQLGR
jgi:aldose 1-epimerase